MAFFSPPLINQLRLVFLIATVLAITVPAPGQDENSRTYRLFYFPGMQGQSVIALPSLALLLTGLDSLFVLQLLLLDLGLVKNQINNRIFKNR